MSRPPAPPRPERWLAPTPRRIYILPTRACLSLGAVGLAMAYAALSQNNAGAYLLGFFLGSLAIVSMVHTHFALTGLSLRVRRVEPTFAGQPAQVSLALENTTRRARRGVFRVAPARPWRWPWETRPTPAAVAVAAPAAAPAPAVTTVTPLAGNGQADLLLPVQTVRRGERALGTLVVTTTYPLGFFRGMFYEETDTRFLVYPAPAGARPLPWSPAAVATLDLPAVTPSAAGDDYVGSRPYLPGDSQRHVDWRAAARGQGLLVKQFAGSGRDPLWFDWRDLDMPGAEPEATEARLSQLCRWLLDAEATAELPYGLRLPDGTEFPPERGEAHLRRCLRALALWGGEKKDEG